MNKNTHSHDWKKKVVVHVTDTGRFKALSPCGAFGYGRTSEAAIHDCAKAAGVKLH